MLNKDLESNARHGVCSNTVVQTIYTSLQKTQAYPMFITMQFKAKRKLLKYVWQWQTTTFSFFQTRQTLLEQHGANWWSRYSEVKFMILNWTTSIAGKKMILEGIGKLLVP